MTSPFPSNAILTFSVPTGQLIMDPATGNVIPEVAPLTVKAYLAPDGVQSNYAPEDNTPGVNDASERMSGRMTEPQQVPLQISNLSEADAVINGQPGRFLLRIPTQDAWGVSDVLGDRIYGIFTANPDRAPLPVAELAFPAAYPISSDRLVAIVDGQLYYADHRNPAHASAIVGMTRTAVNTGESPLIAETGVLNGSGWNWTPGLPLFLYQDGQMTQNAALIEEGFILPVGKAVRNTQIILEIEDPTFLQ
jgi:hypothetical protein